jgi:outer membrane protein OmpA-like peptidoglycan-associated protein
LAVFRLYGADIPKSWGEPDPNKTDPEPTKCFCNDVETGEQITYECGSPLPERCKDGEIVFDFAVEAIKNFPIDEAVLTQEAKDIIDENIVKIWNPIPQYRKEEYLEFLEDKTIVVNAYASIDALSNFPDGGRYAGCSKYGLGKGPRVKYNQCLSEARAKAVVEYLKTIANGAFKDVNFVAVGKGETNQWSGLVWNQPETKIKDGVPQNVKSPYSNEETRPDRRFEIKFPAYHKEE